MTKKQISNCGRLDKSRFPAAWIAQRLIEDGDAIMAFKHDPEWGRIYRGTTPATTRLLFDEQIERAVAILEKRERPIDIDREVEIRKALQAHERARQNAIAEAVANRMYAEMTGQAAR